MIGDGYINFLKDIYIGVIFEYLVEMKLSKLLYIIALCFLFVRGIAGGPCEFEVTYKVSPSGKAGYQILLQAAGQSARFNLKLYDLNSGEVVEEKQLQLNVNEEKVAFERVKPSNYIIYISSETCPKPKALGGIGGIKVGN